MWATTNLSHIYNNTGFSFSPVKSNVIQGKGKLNSEIMDKKCIFRQNVMDFDKLGVRIVVWEIYVRAPLIHPQFIEDSLSNIYPIPNSTHINEVHHSPC